jgi:hypothetical protein
MIFPKKEIIISINYFFFFLISQNIYIKKAQRGATQRTQEVYKGKPKGGKRSEKENQGN